MKNYKFKINGSTYSVDINNVEGQVIELELNGTPYKVEVDREVKQTPKARPVINASKPVANAPKVTVSQSSSAGVTPVKSPLPGTILDVFVNVGDTVKEGQKLVLLEAMKMENEINAECDGVVKEVKVRKGDVIMEADVLVTIGG
ncbi:MAG: biotin/lipoyl-binding protein [Bacteroidales bacterium]|nr:biotin/lipoyl-binding protein [Bacteroidales bacterium]